ncbi:hypothetical protein O3P69_011093 [Scylla paramamosain]|uniref:SET domain-containing protein n=1 Tax=Scylla paramamosain TaxID=85552 RepID=A0AAW0SSS6_SCYPA
MNKMATQPQTGEREAVRRYFPAGVWEDLPPIERKRYDNLYRGHLALSSVARRGRPRAGCRKATRPGGAARPWRPAGVADGPLSGGQADVIGHWRTAILQQRGDRVATVVPRGLAMLKSVCRDSLTPAINGCHPADSHENSLRPAINGCHPADSHENSLTPAINGCHPADSHENSLTPATNGCHPADSHENSLTPATNGCHPADSHENNLTPATNGCHPADSHENSLTPATNGCHPADSHENSLTPAINGCHPADSHENSLTPAINGCHPADSYENSLTPAINGCHPADSHENSLTPATNGCHPADSHENSLTPATNGCHPADSHENSLTPTINGCHPADSHENSLTPAINGCHPADSHENSLTPTINGCHPADSHENSLTPATNGCHPADSHENSLTPATNGCHPADSHENSMTPAINGCQPADSHENSLTPATNGCHPADSHENSLTPAINGCHPADSHENSMTPAINGCHPADSHESSLTPAINGCHPADSHENSLTPAINGCHPADSLSPAVSGSQSALSHNLPASPNAVPSAAARAFGASRQQEGVLLDTYLSALADGSLDPLCSYIEGMTEALAPSPPGSGCQAVTKEDPEAASAAEAPSPGGCDAWLGEMVQALRRAELCCPRDEAWEGERAVQGGREGMEQEMSVTQVEAEDRKSNKKEDEKDKQRELKKKEEEATMRENTTENQLRKEESGDDRDKEGEDAKGKEQAETTEGKEEEEIKEKQQKTKIKTKRKEKQDKTKEELTKKTGKEGKSEEKVLKRRGAADEDKENMNTCKMETTPRATWSRQGPGPLLSLSCPAGGAPSRPQAEQTAARQRRTLRPRNRRHCYEEDNIPADDDFLYCEECEMEWVGECSLHPLTLVLDTPVCRDGRVSQRARLTAPWPLQVAPSQVEGAGLGVWTAADLPPRLVFGPYEGRLLSRVEEGTESGYGWRLRGQSDALCCVDAVDATISNWMRYVNCARSEAETNLGAFQYKAHIYYKTLRAIPRGSELMVWYGDEYGAELGLSKSQVPSRACTPMGNYSRRGRRHPHRPPASATLHFPPPVTAAPPKGEEIITERKAAGHGDLRDAAPAQETPATRNGPALAPAATGEPSAGQGRGAAEGEERRGRGDAEMKEVSESEESEAKKRFHSPAAEVRRGRGGAEMKEVREKA